VSGTVNVQGNAEEDLSQMEFYVDWQLQQTASTSPFSFAWNTSGVSKGSHTVAAMAINTEGMSACYAVALNIQQRGTDTQAKIILKRSYKTTDNLNRDAAWYA